MAKTHLNSYLKNLNKKKEEENSENQFNQRANPTLNLIGHRHISNGKKQIMFESLAVQFISRLQESFDDFREYCINISFSDNDCAILDTDWTHLDKI